MCCDFAQSCDLCEQETRIVRHRAAIIFSERTAISSPTLCGLLNVGAFSLLVCSVYNVFIL